tara:strand:- start:2783 stop:3328 length:546 start_codon:yes stop_codon:yes gene_type:complete
MQESGEIEGKSAFLLDVIKRYDHYIATTNFKIGLMMSFIGVVALGLTIRAMSITPTQTSCNTAYYLAITTSVLTIATALFSSAKLLQALSPNTKSLNEKKSLIYFGDVSKHKNGIEGYKASIENITPEEILQDLAEQAFILAEVATEKFEILKTAVNTLKFGTIPLLGISILLLIAEGATS